MKNQGEEGTRCCPEFDPAPWDDKTFTWENKKFIKDRVKTFFYMPLCFGKVMRRLDEKVRNAGATISGCLCLSDHTSKWNMDVYLAVDKDIPGTGHATLSGTFYSKVYSGSYSETGTWCKEFESRMKAKGLSVKKWYMWYTTCPKCAKKYGKNYTVIIGQI